MEEALAAIRRAITHGSFGIEAEVEKACGLLAQSSIFGRYLPACSISQTGGMGSRSPASTRSNGLRTIGAVTLLP